jgi:general secretion pathway protein E
MAERLFTPEQVAQLLGTPSATVSDWVRAERIQSLRLPDGPVRISEKQLLDFLQQEGIDIEELMARSVLRGTEESAAATPAARGAYVPVPARSNQFQRDPARPPESPRPTLALANQGAPAPGSPQPVPFEGTVEEAYEAALRGSTRTTPAPTEPATTDSQTEDPFAQVPEPSPPDVAVLEDDLVAAPSVSDDRPTPDETPPAPQEASPRGEAVTAQSPESPVEEAPEPADRAPEPEPPAPRKRPKSRRKSAASKATAKRKSLSNKSVRKVARPRPKSKRPADPAAQLAEAIIADAISRGASAIHLASDGESLSLRLRCQGQLQERAAFRRRLPAGLGPQLVAHLKMCAGLASGATGPVDAALEMQVDSRAVSLGLSLLPTLAGEAISLRLDEPSPAAERAGSDSLGLPEADTDRLEALLSAPAGLLLVAAPPRHGVDTLSRAIAQRLAARRKGVFLLERRRRDPVKGVEQCVCDGSAGLDLSRGLQAALRQDPDAIVLEDLPDPVSAAACVDAASHGCLVVAGVRADDGPGAVALLRRMGVGAWPLGSALLGLMARRTLRTPCPECRRSARATRKLLDPLGMRPSEVDYPLYAPRGCVKCGQTGYAGTVTLTSLIPAGEGSSTDEAVRADAAPSEIARSARTDGARDLLDAAVDALREGLTTVEEIAAQRITRA